jgi:predicted small secreted protein
MIVKEGGMALNWKSFMIGVGSGLVGGFAAYYLLANERICFVSAEKVLDEVKAAFKEQGQIFGSWIHMEAQPFEKNHLKYMVYKGGITRNNNGKAEQYEFVADARTGTILSVEKMG